MPGDYFILQLDTPSVLVECGFISNPTEEALLLSPAYQEKLGEALRMARRSISAWHRQKNEGCIFSPRMVK